MKIKNVLTVVAAACAVFAQAAMAQPASAPASRADVKADTRADQKSGTLVPAGQGPGAMTSGGTGSTSSTTTRAERKDTTKAARASGELKPTGEAAELKDDKAEKQKTA